MEKINFIILNSVIVLLLSTVKGYSNNLIQNSATIKGTVKNIFDERLEDATVEVINTNYSTSTDLNGNFEINNLPEGSYTLSVSFIGYKTMVKNINLPKNGMITVDFVLEASENILNEVYIKGQSLKKSATTVDVIGKEKIKNLIMTIDQPLRIIEQVPGVNIIAFAQGGVADDFSIRGFEGGHSGGAGVEVDGISLNEAEGHADGYADLNVLIPLNINKIKVYKGPSSVLFGRFGLGGTLAIETRKRGEYNDISIKGGSYNTLDAQYAQGNSIHLKNDKNLQTNFALQLYSTDGYVKKYSEVLKGNIDGRVSYNLSDKTDISLSIRGHKSNWNAPGYIPESQFFDDDNRDKPNPYAENDGGAKTYFSERLDLNHKISENIKLLLFGYALQQDFTRYAKFNFEPTGQTERFNTRDVFATGGSLNGNSKFGKITFDWLTGLEFYSEKTLRDQWNTAYRKRIEKIEERVFDIQSLSAFIQGDFNIHKFFKPSIGVRFDTYSGNFENNDPNTTKTTENIKNLSHISPKFGFRSSVFDDIDFRASLSNGFSLPNSALKYDSTTDLDPIELWQYEIGITVTKSNWLEFDIAAYILNSSKEIITLPGTDEIINAGKTRRSGIETKIDINITKGLNFTGSSSFNQTEIIEHPLNKGKSLTGIPSSILTLGLSYISSSTGLGADLNFRDVGDSFINTDNSKKYNGYSLTNATIFYNLSKTNFNKGKIFLTVNNIFNEKYASSMWEGYDTINYAPAPTRNFSLGINYSF